MLDKQVIDSVVAASKECCNPAHGLGQYLQALLISIFDVLGYNPEELAFREGIEEAIKIELDAPRGSFIVLDLGSIMVVPSWVESCNDCSFAIATQTIGFDFPSDFYNDLDNLLRTGLSGVSNCYAGLVESPQQVTELASSSKVLQVRRTTGDGALSPRFDYMLEIDAIWAALPAMGNAIKGIIVWDSKDANETGYVGEDLMPYERSLPVFRCLSSVLELPDEVGAWLFEWKPEQSETTFMIDCSSLSFEGLSNCLSQKDLRDKGKMKEVTNYEIALNRNFCPAYYVSGNFLHAKDVPLRCLAKKVQRGTTLSGKDLDVLGTIYKKDPAKDKSHSPFVMVAGIGGRVPLGLKSSSYIIYGNDAWYVDNACIQPDGTVIPKVISEIPEGQQRYTLYPDDGMCILIPRNGKAIVPFIAKAPTLVSNNLFLVRLAPDKVNREYLSCLLRSSLLKEQIAEIAKPLSKEEVEGIVVPVMSEEEQVKVVEYDSGITDKIIELQNEIATLEMLDPFDPLRALGLELKRRVIRGELEGEIND